MRAAKCGNEEARLEALGRYGILDTERDPAYDEITSLISHACQAPIAVINLIDRDRQWFKSEVGLGVRETPLETSICAHALLQRGILIVNDTLEDPRFSDNPLVTGRPGLRFYAGALLETADGHALGTLCVLDFRPRDLTEDQKELLKVLAHQVMKQLELHRTVAQLEETVNRQHQMEVQLTTLSEKQTRIAETLQRSMLIAPPENSFRGLSIKTVYEAALDEALVGGDFFDAFGLDDHTVALVVGDVSGKGLEAAARTAEVKYALRAYLHALQAPGLALAQVNDFLCQIQEMGGGDGFIVMAVIVVDTQTGEITAASAGAEPAIILRRDNTFATLLCPGQPLGIAPGVYAELRDRIEEGDTIILLTDGLTEARCGGAFMGTEGIADIAQAVGAGAQLGVLAKSLIEGARNYSGGHLRDDACLLLARR